MKGCFDSIWLPQFPLTCLHVLPNTVKSHAQPALDSTQIKSISKYFANEIVQLCGKGYENEVTAMGYNYPTFSYSVPDCSDN